MTEAAPKPARTDAKSMDEIMALCKRRGFIFQASEIYGGINGFWDYGPLGALLKKNLRDAWWEDVVLRPPTAPGALGEVEMVPLDTCIIQHPRVWEASGHVAGFNDMSVDCRETKRRYRYDHVSVYAPASGDAGEKPVFAFVSDTESEGKQRKKAEKTFGEVRVVPLTTIPVERFARVIGPDAEKAGTLTEPRKFGLMFESGTGAVSGEQVKVYLRPETAQGIFINFKNVVDTMRVRVPFGIAQTGKAFRNEVTPRNFTFRSREFEQMEIEFFCHESQALEWYAFWRDWRLAWWRRIGLASDNLQLREHEAEELAHYSKATCDIEYRFPFTAPGFGELEGVAYRGDFDLRQHQEHSKVKLDYFDTERGPTNPKTGQPAGERYLPHVIEPSAGLDRGVLALICEAYTPDASRPSGVYMKFSPRVAPIKAGVFPLVNKDGMPEKAEALARELRRRFGVVEYDPKQTIGKRYARMDEAGAPFCFTIDGDTMKDHTVTVRHRDTLEQERIGGGASWDEAIGRIAGWLGERLRG